MLTQPIRDLILLALALTCAPVSSKAAVPTASLKGLVLNERGAAVPGAQVLLLNKATGDSRSAIPADNGEFHFLHQPDRDYVVTVRAPGFQERHTLITLAQAHAAPLMQFLLAASSSAGDQTSDGLAAANSPVASAAGVSSTSGKGSDAAPAAPAALFSLKGLVQDESGAVVPGAKVKVLNKDTKKTHSGESKENGEFEFTLEPAGQYVVTIKAKGFQDSETPVNPQRVARSPIRFLLELEEASDKVTVSAQAFAAPSVNDPIDAVHLGDGILRELPDKGGDVLAIPMLFASPSVTGGAGPKLIVDGVESDSLDVPQTGVKQVTINQSPYSAEYSSPGRGRLEVITNKGSRRRLKTNFMFQLRNSALSARNPFATVKPLEQRGIVDAEADGPITSLLSATAAVRYDSDTERQVVNAFTPLGSVIGNVRVPERKTSAFTRLDYRSPNRAHKAVLTYKFKNKSERNRGVGGFNLEELGVDEFDHENEIKFLDTLISETALLNQFSISFKQSRSDLSSVASGPRIVVLDAFSGSGAQRDQRLRQSGATIQNYASIARGLHTIRFGGSAKLRRIRATDASNFGGTYRFSSLADYTAGTPYVYSVNEGNPAVSFGHYEFSSFVEDDIRLRPNLSLMAGLRHEAQTRVDKISNFAPRLGIAYSPGGRGTVVRAGAGVFYDRQSTELERRSLLYDGLRIREIVLREPGFPALLDPAGALPFTLPSIERLEPLSRVPYLFQTSAGIDQHLGKGVLSLEYQHVRGVHLYRTRNVNAPVETGFRPNPAYLNVNQFETSGTSCSNALLITFKAQPLKKTELIAQYTLASSRDDIGDLYRLPANNYDLRPEWGRSDFDRRHRFNFVGAHRLPLDLRFGWVTSFYSGIPYDITTGRDDNRDTVANDRPLGLGRNSGFGPRYSNIDLRLARDVKFGPDEKLEAQFGVEAFNVLNSTSFQNYIGTQTSPFFGRANAAYPGRQLQLSLRIKM